MSTTLIIFLIITFGMMFIGLPAAFAMFSGAAYYFIANNINMNAFIQNMLAGANSYTMLAVPLFILAASVMNGTGTTRKLFDFSEKLVGHLPGGICHVNILTSVIFAGMSGSAVADTAGIGYMCCEEMRKRDYGDGFSNALTITTSTIGPIIPPSIPMVIYATFAEVSVGKLFIGGVFPGLIMAVAMSVYCILISKSHNFPRMQKAGREAVWKAFLKSIPVLLEPVILLYCIYSGVCTPTEAAVICSLYGILVGIFIEKDLSLKKFRAICVDVCRNVGVTLLVLIAASLFANIISRENLPKYLIGIFQSMHLGKTGTFILINVLFLILGCFLPQSAIQFAVVPIMIPIVSAAGINLVHFGVVIVLNMMLGMCTPPFGNLLFLISGLTGVSMKETVREVWPQVGILIFVMLLCTVFEPLVMWLPNLMK